jgi:hypothetical protein
MPFWVTQCLWLDRLMARGRIELTGGSGIAFGLRSITRSPPAALRPISRLRGFHASVTIAILSVN